MGTPLRALLIEDSEDDAMLIARALMRGGYAAHTTRIDTPGGLLEALDGQAWDIVIADHSMPRFSAPEALAILKQRGWDLPFIIVSGTITEEIAVMAMRAGAHDFIMKDNLARLVPAVERELREATIRREHHRDLNLATRLLKIFDTAVNEIYVFEAIALRFVQVNQRARQNLGYSIPELEGMTPVDLAPEFDLQQFTRAIAPLLAGIHEQLVIETVCRRKDGSIYPVALHLQLSRAEEPSLFFAIVTDLTEQKRAERALRDSQEAERRRIASALQGAVMSDFRATLDALHLARARSTDAMIANELTRAITSIHHALQELRGIVFNLGPAVSTVAGHAPPTPVEDGNPTV